VDKGIRPYVCKETVLKLCSKAFCFTVEKL